MKKRVLLSCLLLIGSIGFTMAQIYQTAYIDFGPNDGTNGNETIGADLNGNFWTNVTDEKATASSVSILDKQGNASDWILEISSDFNKNGIKNGGLLSSDALLLGDLAINTVTQDYFFAQSSSAQLKISGLVSSKGYIFSMFGTRESTSTRKTQYTVQGQNLFVDTLQTSGASIGANSYNGNNQIIIVTDTIMADVSGSILITISQIEGGFSYLAGLKVEEVNPIMIKAGEAFKTSYIDFGPNDGSNGNTTATDSNGKLWNNITDISASSSLFYIYDDEGLSTGKHLSVTSNFFKNGIQNGGLLAPEERLLGDLAINTVTQDYFFVESSAGRLLIGGLDRDKGYVFSLFGTRESNDIRKTEYTVQGLNIYSDTLQTSGTAIGDGAYNGNNQNITVTDTIMADTLGQIFLTVKKIEGAYAYLGALKMQEVPPVMVQDTFVLCKERDRYNIAVMGSSVAYGTGASNQSLGYASLYGQLLNERYNHGTGSDWDISNISIGGNSTLNVLDRWDADLLPLCSKYVVYGLSVGNEGITNGGQVIFDQFRNNMQLLIQKSREKGMEPIIVNCYTRGDYSITDYDYVKKMNLLIHSWDVASVNVLGAIDDEAGKWALGYMNDVYHPNNEGHKEFMYSFIPSLFDALDAGKPQPEIVEGTYLRLKPDSANFMLELNPEEVLHPFTISFDIQTALTGPIFQFETSLGTCSLSINDQGALDYLRGAASQIQGTTVLNDSAWHKITLTHYYAKGKTRLYIDNVLQGGIDERMVSSVFNIGASNGPIANYKELLFYRSALNANEVNAMVDGQLLKSSLEIYSPLDEKAVYSVDTLVNLAQSTNRLIKVPMSPISSNLHSTSSADVYIYPNPAGQFLSIKGDDVFSSLTITDIKGESLMVINTVTETIDISSLSSGIYLIRLKSPKGMYTKKFIKIDA